jgi:predicted RNA-binding Zn ribbon-like protein
MASNPAPGELERVRRFVNTWDVEEEQPDAIATPDALTTWLAGEGLLAKGDRVTAADVRRTQAVRDALRATLRSHHGEELDTEAPEILCEASRRARLEVRFGDDGSSRLEPAAGGVDGAIGRLLTIAHEAEHDGTWQRLKICPADDCQWAFYDESRNRSAVWCSMKVCGNRHKVREYRARSVRPTKGTTARARAR